MKNPQEGYDYLTDLYTAIGASADADPEAIDQYLAQKETTEYQEAMDGVRGQLLGRARRILTDPGRRSAYDMLLREWKGPVSRDGNPVMGVAEHIRHQYADLAPHVVEIDVRETERQACQAIGYEPGRLSFLRQLVCPETSDELLLQEYDTALFDKDRVLATVEQKRGQLVGVDHIKQLQNNVRPGHRDAIVQAVREAKTSLSKRHLALIAGNFMSRIMSLYGDVMPTFDAEPLPAYFDSQARELSRVAQQRETVLGQRLRAYRPTYLNKDSHCIQPSHLIMVNGENRKIGGFTFDTGGRKLVLSHRMPSDVTPELYAPLAADGYEVIRIDPRLGIDEDLLITEALHKYSQQRDTQSPELYC